MVWLSFAREKKEVHLQIGTVIVNPMAVERRNTLESYKQLSHTIYLCNYHAIFCPKYRFRILHGTAGQKVRNSIRRLCEWKGTEIVEGNVWRDHVHLVLSISPEYAVS